jgi:hypothetical protein
MSSEITDDTVDIIYESLYNIVVSRLYEPSSLNRLNSIDMNVRIVPQNIKGLLEELINRLSVHVNDFEVNLIEYTANKCSKGSRRANKCRALRMEKFNNLLILAIDGFDLLRVIYKSEEHIAIIKSVLLLISSTIILAYKSAACPRTFIHSYNILRAIGQEERAHKLLCDSMYEISNSIWMDLASCVEHERLWICKLLLLTDIDADKMDTLLGQKCVKYGHNYILLSYIIHSSYELSTQNKQQLLNNLLSDIDNMIKHRIEHGYISNDYASKIISLYISILKLITRYKVTLNAKEESTITQHERVITMDLLYCYIIGRNKQAYKVYKLLEAIGGNLTPIQKKFMVIIADKLYTPSGNEMSSTGYLEAGASWGRHCGRSDCEAVKGV